MTLELTDEQVDVLLRTLPLLIRLRLQIDGYEEMILEQVYTHLRTKEHEHHGKKNHEIY